MLELPLPYMHQLLKNDGTIVFDNVLYKVDIGKELSDASGVDAFTSFGFPFQVIRDKSVQDKLNDYLVNNRAVLEDMIEESLAQQVQNNPVTEQRRSNVANYDLFKMFIKDVDELNDTVLHRLRKLPGVKHTETILAMQYFDSEPEGKRAGAK